jgi:tripartite-type tricarboxylate transporter receptor subunit TctC
MFTFKKFLSAMALAACAFTGGALAADYPSRPVKVIMPFPPGTGPDNVMRMIAEKLTAEWKQQVIVENRPGGNSWIAVEAFKRSAADGYTLIFVDSPLVALQQHLYKKLPYDPVADFMPVAAVFRTNYLVTVAPDSKYKSVQELVAAAKANPGKITYGSSGYGGNLHLGGAMLASVTGAPMTHIPYKETGQIYIDVNRGEIDWAFGTASTTKPLYQAKKLKYLAVSAPQRLAAFPDLPTLQEVLGTNDVDLQTWLALYAPRGTPVPIIEQVNATIKKLLAQPEVRAQLANSSFEPFVQTPSELAATAAKESTQYADLVKRLNISLD